MKTCGSSRHEGERELDDSHFAPCELKKKGNGTCRDCVRKQTKAWREQNSVRSKELYAKSYDKNKETILEKSRANQHLNNEYSKVYRQKNKQQRYESGKKWRDANKDRIRFYANARRAMKLQATPKWAEAEWEQILALYAEAQRLEQETGIKYHVDHIIPLQSELVCGLHCLSNLRVITQKENNQKNNKLLDEFVTPDS